MQGALAVATIVGLIPAIVLAEHDRTLEDLRKSEQRFQLAVQGSTDGIWDWNIMTNDVFYSGRFCELLGYSRAEFPDIFASFELAAASGGRGSGAPTGRSPFETPDALRCTNLDCEPNRRSTAGFGAGPSRVGRPGPPGANGRLAHRHHRRQAQCPVDPGKRKKFSKAFRSSPNGIALTELATGRYIDVNDSFCQIYGYTKEEMLGRTSVELGIFDSMEDRRTGYRPPSHHRAYQRCRTADAHAGRRKQSPLVQRRTNRVGRQACIVFTLFDITARLQIEERLEKTTRQLRALTYRLQSLREEERTHLAREIHDHLGQLLTALSLDLRLIDRRAANVADAELRAALHNKITAARALADETITAVQKIATELRPAILDRLGLEAAIETETQAFQVRSGINCQWTLPNAPMSLDSVTRPRAFSEYFRRS